MRKLQILIIALSLGVTAWSQNGTPQETSPAYRADTLVEALIALAMKNPQIASADNIAKQFKYNYRRTRSQWLDNIVLTGNLNEFSIEQNGNDVDPLKQSTQYPRWNVGVRLPVGLFFNNGKESKAMMYKYKSTENDAEAIKLTIRKQVTVVYEDYKMNKELIALEQETLQDAKFLFTKTEEKFQKGEVSLELYTTAGRLYNAERAKVINLDRNFNISKAQLEELIGMDLDLAIKQINSPDKSLMEKK
jgi:outer membrane protein TolC